MNTGIYIDDSGTTGQVSGSRFSSPNTKSWYAVVFTPSNRVLANAFMHDCLKDLKKDYNANEFHFKDVYNGKNEFKDISLGVRLNILEAFAVFFKEHQFPIVCQSFSPDEYTRNNLVKGVDIQKIDDFNLNNYSDFSLYHLLLRIKSHIADLNVCPKPFEIIIDQDGKKVNVSRTVNLFGDDLLNRQIQYKSSEDEHLIQLADFAAFCLNRVKWIQQNNSHLSKPIDMTFLELCSRADFNTLNMVKKHIEKGTDLKQEHDDLLQGRYDRNKSLPKINVKDYREELAEKNKPIT